MKINLTKEEYRTLLEMLYISDWVMHTFTNGLEDGNKSHKDLKQNILSLHIDIQAEDVLKEYESNEFDEYMHTNFIEKYNENIFWETLIDQLSYRDLAKEIGVDAFNQLDPIERIERLETFRENYTKEFEQHQLANLKIDVGSL